MVASPFLGAFVWRAVARALGSRGERSVTLVPSVKIRGAADDYEAIGELAREVRFERPVWVAHSGAGAILPSLLENASPPGGVIFVDGLLPHPGQAWLDTAPPRLAAMVHATAREGLAAPWPFWFGDRLTELLPDPNDRAALIADAPAIPLEFLSLRAPTVDLPDRTPCAFLRLSAAYESECISVEARGWPVVRREAHHLSIVTDAEPIADHLVALRRRLISGQPAS